MRFTAIILSCMVLLNMESIKAQQSYLAAGPMVTYSEMRESAVWVQLKGPGVVQMAYWPVDEPSKILLSKQVHTDEKYGHVALLVADQVEHSKVYRYNIYINGEACMFNYPTQFQTQKLWQWREDAPDFKFALGSCTYVNEPDTDRPGRAFGGADHIFTSIHSKKPDFMLWLGDNVYLREPDWNSLSGYVRRYSHTRALTEMQPLLGSVHNYAIWDDHDYGPNDSDRTWKHKDIALETFKKFWPATHWNASGGGGITQRIEWSDCDFFLMDDRWFKSPNSMPGEVLGEAQMNWLKSSLLESEAPFKFVALGVMFLSTAANKENMSKAGVPEREELIRFIQENEIKGVVFLTGDRHFSELSLLEEKGRVPIYDLTCSPLTAGPAAAKYLQEKNDLRVEGTFYSDRNFAFLEVSGTQKDRHLSISLHDSNGNTIWSSVIKSSDFNIK